MSAQGRKVLSQAMPWKFTNEAAAGAPTDPEGTSAR